jgi:hypothetical protein
MTSFRRLLLAWVLVLALSGCGDDDGRGGGAEPDGRKQAERIPLERREAPPAGVAEQVSYSALGNGGCPSKADAPEIRLLSRVVEINHSPYVCLLGFAPERPVELTLRRPDGRSVVERVEPQGDLPVRTVVLLAAPQEPVGRYGVTARQGSTRATSSFEVRRASQPRLRAIENHFPPGQPVRLGFAGFRPTREVRFHLYRQRRSANGRFTYLASMTARMDENGEAIHEIPTDPGSPPIHYLARVTKDVEAAFWVDEPPPE